MTTLADGGMQGICSSARTGDKMHNFRFVGHDMDKGKFSFMVKATDKAKAIDKAFAVCKKKRLEAGLSWRCEFIN